MSKKGGPKPVKDDTPYEIRDIVLAKIRGFPPWPAMIVDPDSVPGDVSKERPRGKGDNFYCVRFFPAGDYAWVLTKNMNKLKKHEVEAYLVEPNKAKGELLNAYKIALDPEKWEQEKEEQRMISEDAKAEEEVDELEGEEEVGDDDKPKKNKKRKRDSEAAAKPKAKAKASKADSETSTKKKKGGEKAEKPAKGKKNGSKSKAMVESEDEGEREDDAGPSKKASPPPAKKKKQDKEAEPGDLETDSDAQKVKEWRHKLQRAFLGKVPPKDEDMPQYDNLFNQVEDYEMPITYLQYSKIGKVMRHIAAQDDDKVPRDAEFRFKDRAQALVNKWHQTITPAKANGTNGAVEEKSMDVDKSGVGDTTMLTVADESIAELGRENGLPAHAGAEATGDGADATEGAAGDVAMAEA